MPAAARLCRRGCRDAPANAKRSSQSPPRRFHRPSCGWVGGMFARSWNASTRWRRSILRPKKKNRPPPSRIIASPLRMAICA
eukprot:2242508-Pyramimonas_sp.AAC.1